MGLAEPSWMRAVSTAEWPTPVTAALANRSTSTRTATAAGGAIGADVERGEMHAHQRGGANRREGDGPPQADGGQPGSPVPAVAELCLAHCRALGVAAPGTQGLALDALARRVEPHREHIVIAERQVEHQRAEHIAVL